MIITSIYKSPGGAAPAQGLADSLSRLEAQTAPESIVWREAAEAGGQELPGQDVLVPVPHSPGVKNMSFRLPTSLLVYLSSLLSLITWL